jgi:chromosome partitioning protein
VFKTIVQRNVRISEAPSFGKPVILYDATSIGSRNYIALAREILHNNQRYLQQPEVQEEAEGGGSDGQHGVSSPPRPPTPANGFAL